METLDSLSSQVFLQPGIRVVDLESCSPSMIDTIIRLDKDSKHFFLLSEESSLEKKLRTDLKFGICDLPSASGEKDLKKLGLNKPFSVTFCMVPISRGSKVYFVGSHSCFPSFVVDCYSIGDFQNAVKIFKDQTAIWYNKLGGGKKFFFTEM